jgi:glutamyl/glutaminyl-tRNA synthetase
MFGLTARVDAYVVQVVHAALAHLASQHLLADQLGACPIGALQAKRWDPERVLTAVGYHERGTSFCAFR